MPNAHKTHTPSKLGRSIYTPNEMSSASRMCDAMIAKSNLSPEMAGYLYYTSLPKSHKDYLSNSDAAKEFFPGESIGTVDAKAKTAARNVLKDILFGVDRLEYEKEREEQGLTPTVRGRRPKEEREQEKAFKEHVAQVRAKLGMSPRGRISVDKIDEYNRLVNAFYDETEDETKTEQDVPETVAEAEESTEESTENAPVEA